MSVWRVNLVSAFGRGGTLALALHKHGFQVKILDFTSAFSPDYDRGPGPFPIIDKAFIPDQKEYLHAVEPLSRGISFWLQDGPLELTGPFAEIHLRNHPELRAWKSNSSSGEFTHVWLQRFLRQWASPYFSESWADAGESIFPAQETLGLIPEAGEQTAQNFDGIQLKGVDVQSCQGLREVRVQSSRIQELVVESGSAKAISGDQWLWCLSSSETAAVGKDVAGKLFPRGIRTPEWAWVSFAGQIRPGSWSGGLPIYVLLMGDICLPWTYSNATILQRLDETRCRFWLKVPRNRVDDIDARRNWATELQRLLHRRLPLAEWTVNSAEWSLCPHSEIYSTEQRPETPTTWKNWDLITPETLPRLDVSARLQREAEVMVRLTQWRNDQMKKQGAPRDRTLHAP